MRRRSSPPLSCQGRGDAGYAMLELIIGAVIMAVAITGLMRVWPVFSRAQLAMKQRTAAVLVAQEKIEELKARPASLRSGRFPFKPSVNWCSAQPGEVDRRCHYRVKKTGRVVELTVVVGWGGGPGQTVLLSTIVRTP